jgi:uncharacterized MAPEG superfamily protein
MSASLDALLGFTAWTLVLVFIVLLYRTAIVFTGKQRANAWPRGMPPPAGEPPFFTRVGHAHQNCVEGLPIFAALVAIAALSDQLAITDKLAWWVVAARIAQSVTHMIGTTHWLVFVRANFFAVQLLLYAFMIIGLLP